MADTRGRQVVLALTNKSGGSVAAGDVVVIDTTTDESFTTTTSGRAELSVGVAQETIASNAVGRVLASGYAALVNVPASVTRGHYIETHTVVKQATGNSTRRSGSFGQFAKTSATPSGWLWGSTDQAVSSALTSAAADSTADVTLTADTIADATGVSVSLAAGTWFIWAEMTFSATTATYDYCLVNITDAANAVVGEARGEVASNTPNAWVCFAQVAPGSTTTYKLRGQSGRTGNKILRYGQGTNIGTRMIAIKVA